jgi:hypothetical protein
MTGRRHLLARVVGILAAIALTGPALAMYITHSPAEKDASPKVRFASDSPVEEAVYCELVSEMKFPES